MVSRRLAGALTPVSRASGRTRPGEAALIRALGERRIAGVALDVFAEEPLPATSPLWSLPNVIVTPHIAGEPAGYAERFVSQVFADNLARFRGGQPLQNVVDLARGY